MKPLSFDYTYKFFAIDDSDYLIGVKRCISYPETLEFEIYKGDAQGYYELYDSGFLDTAKPVENAEEAYDELRLYYSDPT